MIRRIWFSIQAIGACIFHIVVMVTVVEQSLPACPAEATYVHVIVLISAFLYITFGLAIILRTAADMIFNEEMYE